MNFVEEQQREAGKKYPEDGSLEYYEGSCDIDQEELAELVQQTITNTLNHILESGLLEEVRTGTTMEWEGKASPITEDGADGHNTLARDIKEFISNMDTNSVGSIHLNKQAN